MTNPVTSLGAGVAKPPNKGFFPWQPVLGVLLVLSLLFAGFATWRGVSYREQAEQLTGEMASLNAQLASTQSQLSESISQMQTKNDELDTIRGDLATTQTRLTTTEDEIRRTREDLRQAQESVAHYKGQVSDLTQDLKESGTKLETCFSDVYYSMNYSFLRSSPLGFKLLCAEGYCQATEAQLDTLFSTTTEATSLLQADLGIRLEDYFRSVEVHASWDSSCPEVDNYWAYARSIGYSSGLPRGQICLDTTRCDPTEGRCDPDTGLLIHELAHMLWLGQDIPPSFNEGFSMVLEVLHGAESRGYSTVPISSCDGYFHQTAESIVLSRYNKGMELFHELCKRHGFDIDDLPAFFDLAEQQPTYHTTGLSFETFISFISQITGQNVKPTFDEILSIPTQGAVCGDGKCSVDESYYCKADC